MDLQLKHRCPWCGEVVEDIRSKKYNIKECGGCGHEYTYHNDGALSKISDFLGIFWIVIAALSMSNILIAIIYGILFVLAKLFICKNITYERYDDSDIKYDIKKHKAKFTFDQNNVSSWDYIKTRIFLSEKSIVPICFADENNYPLSHVICICMEGTRIISKTKYECIFSFLPQSDVSYDVSKTRDFYLFDGNRKRVGKGSIIPEYTHFVR